jgi:hypothetical protein
MNRPSMMKRHELTQPSLSRTFFSIDNEIPLCYICEVKRAGTFAVLAGVAQLVEHNLAKVGVTSSNLATRSINDKGLAHTG